MDEWDENARGVASVFFSPKHKNTKHKNVFTPDQMFADEKLSWTKMRAALQVFPFHTADDFLSRDPDYLLDSIQLLELERDFP